MTSDTKYLSKIATLAVLLACLGLTGSSCSSNKTVKAVENAKPSISISIHFERIARTEWRVDYQTSEPVSSLQFVRQAYRFRAKHWQSLSPGIQIVERGGKEEVVKDAEAPFTSASFKFGPYTEKLDREYDFSYVLSDGGMAFFTGHFLAMPIDFTDSGRHNQQIFRLSASAPNEVIFHYSGSPANHINWQETDSESSFVLATAGKVRNGEKYALVLEPNLPAWLKNKVSRLLPEIFSSYEKRFGFFPPVHPLIFLTNDIVTGEAKPLRYRGSASHGAIQFSFVGPKWTHPTQEGEERLVYFLSHEIAHFWNAGSVQDDDIVGWMTEGSADAFSNRISLSLRQINQRHFLELQSKAAERCASILSAPNCTVWKATTKAIYECGNFVALITEAIVHKKNSSQDLFHFWIRFMENTKANNGAYTRETYFKTLDEWADGSPLESALEHWIYSPHRHSHAEILNLLKSSGIAAQLSKQNLIQITKVPWPKEP